MEQYKNIQKVFSVVIGEDLENVSVQTALVPLNEFHHFSFTDQKISLQKRYCGICEIGQKDGEPSLKIKQTEGRFYNLLKWEKVLLVKPKHGNLSPLWIPLKEFLTMVNKLSGSGFIRVYKHIVQNGVPCSNPSLVGVYLEQNFLHDSKGKFFRYKSDLDKSLVFEYHFEKKSAKSNEWVNISDPRKNKLQK